MKEQPLGFLHFFSSRHLHENMTHSWWGMEDAHLKVPQALLARWMYVPKLPDSKTGLFVQWRTDLERPFLPILDSKIATKKVAPHILSIHISPCPTSFGLLPFGLKYSLIDPNNLNQHSGSPTSKQHPEAPRGRSSQNLGRMQSILNSRLSHSVQAIYQPGHPHPTPFVAEHREWWQVWVTICRRATTAAGTGECSLSPHL